MIFQSDRLLATLATKIRHYSNLVIQLYSALSNLVFTSKTQVEYPLSEIQKSENLQIPKDFQVLTTNGKFQKALGGFLSDVHLLWPHLPWVSWGSPTQLHSLHWCQFFVSECHISFSHELFTRRFVLSKDIQNGKKSCIHIFFVSKDHVFSTHTEIQNIWEI